MTETWDIPSAVALYNIDRWGSGYFNINAAGNVQVMPTQAYGQAIDLMDVVAEARERGMAFPLVVRFQDLLRHRVETINRAFQSAITEANYQNVYKGVFPIKVNQLREVVEEIMDAGRPFKFGLEAGSKPELFAALAVHRDPESLIICNGYKDPTFIKNALLGRKLGKQVIMVVEKLEEVYQIVQVSREMGVIPLIGLRVRLQSKGSGKWATSGGENAKFGLSTADLIAASNYLKSQEMAESLVLVHFHVGSQVPDIGVIKRAVREAARFYAKLSKMGHPMQFIDVGGGLGVDYDGSRTAFDSSMNYTLQEYARDVVYNIIDVCDSEKVLHPIIVTRSSSFAGGCDTSRKKSRNSRLRWEINTSAIFRSSNPCSITGRLDNSFRSCRSIIWINHRIATGRWWISPAIRMARSAGLSICRMLRKRCRCTGFDPGSLITWDFFSWVPTRILWAISITFLDGSTRSTSSWTKTKIPDGTSRK
jgi:arginine decarboxylase